MESGLASHDIMCLFYLFCISIYVANCQYNVPTYKLPDTFQTLQMTLLFHFLILNLSFESFYRDVTPLVTSQFSRGGKTPILRPTRGINEPWGVTHAFPSFPQVGWETVSLARRG